MIELYQTREMCCGCEACVNICPKKAVSMKKDGYGFYYPEIDRDKCIECGLCIQKCPLQKNNMGNRSLKAYAAAKKNADILQSASGGISAGIAEEVIRNGGIVYGAGLERRENRFIPGHLKIETAEDLIKIKGSKYVQSRIGTIYADILKELKNGKEVLFTGTPCQTAGLRAFLGSDYQNLILIDIICHGVASAEFFDDYIHCMEKRTGEVVRDFKFRDKTYGWGKLIGKITGEHFERWIPCDESSYYYYYLDGSIYRDSCYACPYACEDRPGDITIGDYWGVEQEEPELLTVNGGVFDSQKGISCVLINTKKGEEYFKKYGIGIESRKTEFSKIKKHNNQLNNPSILNEERRKILDLYENRGYEAVEHYFHMKKLPWIKLKKKIPGGVKKVIRKILRK